MIFLINIIQRPNSIAGYLQNESSYILGLSEEVNCYFLAHATKNYLVIDTKLENQVINYRLSNLDKPCA